MGDESESLKRKSADCSGNAEAKKAKTVYQREIFLSNFISSCQILKMVRSGSEGVGISAFSCPF